jgi:threonyl-tRNA synthetase
MTKSSPETLHAVRHTLAHLLATAVLEHDPGVKLAIGPTIDNGFYYDFLFSEGKVPSPEDLKGLEKRMKHLIKQNLSMVGKEVTADEARKLFAHQPFKTELINEYAGEGKTLTTYTLGTFTDLCKGGHVEKTREIDENAFTLSRIAGAYWRGDEKNPMLTRIYGIAFATKEELDTYQKQIEEAKKRDHRKIGKELGLFIFSELVGPGLPLWTPRGTILREELNDYVWSLRKAKGYQKVTIPHITKKNLYEKSGHWSKYAEDLFRVKTREGNEYAMKPMNCPHHAQIFDAEPRSYRDMPQRYAETTMVYRDEQSGELSGLSRVLSITQDDAHVFCRENQIEAEVFAIWDIINTFYGTFGFTLTPRFSRHDPEKAEKYLGDKATWKKAEDAILALIKKRGVTDYIDGLGEAAIYGPKIDFMAEDALGRTHQVATIQLDFNQPESFDLVCTNEKGEKERIVMIHAAIMGSIERFLSVYIEHVSGTFPLWLSPIQVTIVPVGENHHAYAKEVESLMKDAGIRVALDVRNDSLGKRIREAKTGKVPYVVVIGDKEVESRSVTLESRTEKGILLAQGEAQKKFLHEINTKALS